MPRLVVKSDAAFQVSLADNLEQGGGGLCRQRQVADFIDDEEPRSGVEAHGGGPPAFEGGRWQRPASSAAVV